MDHERFSGDGYGLPHGCRNDLAANALTGPALKTVTIHGKTSDNRRFTAIMGRDTVAEALDQTHAPWRRPPTGANGWRLGPFNLDVDHKTINGYPVKMTVIWHPKTH